jgi:hypothetical protein
MTLVSKTHPVCHGQIALRPNGDVVIPAVLKVAPGICTAVVVNDEIGKIQAISTSSRAETFFSYWFLEKKRHLFISVSTSMSKPGHIRPLQAPHLCI